MAKGYVSDDVMSQIKKDLPEGCILAFSFNLSEKLQEKAREIRCETVYALVDFPNGRLAMNGLISTCSILRPSSARIFTLPERRKEKQKKKRKEKKKKRKEEEEEEEKWPKGKLVSQRGRGTQK